MCQYNLNGDFIQLYDSIADAAKAVNGHVSGICRAAKGEKKSIKGYMWRYYDESVGIVYKIDKYVDARYK